MSWAGIGNDNEFYSEHYLAEVFTKDTKELLDRWRDAVSVRAEATTGAVVDTSATPDALLRSLARELPEVLGGLERARRPADILTLQRPWLQSIAAALALPWAPTAREFDDDLVLPLLGELVDAEGRPLLWLLEALPTEVPLQ